MIYLGHKCALFLLFINGISFELEALVKSLLFEYILQAIVNDLPQLFPIQKLKLCD